MKLVMACVLLGVVSAARLVRQGEEFRPANSVPPIPILHMENVQNADGSFHYSYGTGNQIEVFVDGEQRQVGNESGTVMRGEYSYVAPDGRPIRVTWVADENGFRAMGDTVPSSPPLL